MFFLRYLKKTYLSGFFYFIYIMSKSNKRKVMVESMPRIEKRKSRLVACQRNL